MLITRSGSSRLQAGNFPVTRHSPNHPLLRTHAQAALFAAQVTLEERASHVEEVVSTFKRFRHEVRLCK